ncbi:MAG TPA: Gfo/Idh/MocA family oxidoreductase [Chitinophagaceae bacterium]|nr:Gfo/Idh/MocA family oxidoreductase [Chitinophagales bacterium]HPG10830.1 Gfo/Idh/MocA family oxidoreductase [Chitinophagaceae bacterium]
MNKKQEQAASRRQFIKQSAIATVGFLIVPRFVLGGIKPDGTKYIPPSDLINLGYIGAGKQGNILARSFLGTREVRIVAVSEVYSAKTAQFINRIKEYYTQNSDAGTYSEITAFNDFRDMLGRKDVDAVIIATPDHWHAVPAVLAAKAGKDIYCEKPLSLTVKEGRAMVDATRRNNRVFQTGSMQRSWKEFRQAVELVRNGYIGDIKEVKVNVGAPPVAYNLPEEPLPEGLDWKMWLGPNEYKHFNSELAPPITKDIYPNWRLYKEFGGGMVTDWGAHMFDIAQWALGMDNSGPVKVFPPGTEGHSVLTFYYANGIKMTHEKWEWSNAVYFIGTEGEIKVGRGKLETNPASLATKVIGNNEKHVYHSEDHYKDFLQAIRSRTKPVCDVETGHRTCSVCNIANIAYEIKRPLRWDPVKEKFKKDKAANKLLGRKLLNGWDI